MVCPPVRGDNPRALASDLSPVQVDNHDLTILYQLLHLTFFVLKFVRVGKMVKVSMVRLGLGLTT